jgi:sec-independent protein translocase protein TatC
MLRLKLALWLSLIVSAPVWLYQLWAFVAPGLHRHERKWAYIFVAIAAPLFAAGMSSATSWAPRASRSSWTSACSGRASSR